MLTHGLRAVAAVGTCRYGAAAGSRDSHEIIGLVYRLVIEGTG
jgi:hypothetical protein